MDKSFSANLKFDFATVWTVCFSCHHGKGTNPFSIFSLIAEAFIFTWTKAKILSEKPANFFLLVITEYLFSFMKDLTEKPLQSLSETVDVHTAGVHERSFILETNYRWFSWSVASLPEGKSRGLCLVHLCAKYRLVSATLSPYHQCKKAASLKTSCLLVAHLLSGSQTLNYLYTIYIVYDTLVLLCTTNANAV